MAIIDKKIYEQTPREVISWKILIYCIILSFSGSQHGFNTSNISGVLAMSPFKHHFDLENFSETELANWKAWITSILILGSCVGSLIAAPITDRLGRKWSLALASLVYSLSAILMSANPGGSGGRVELLVGRFLSGAGSGAASVAGTGYMAEISPKAIRGGLMALYNANTMLSVGLGYWVNFGSIEHISADKNAQWQVPMGVQALPGIITIIGLLFVPESPRWLVNHGRHEQAQLALEDLRSLPRDNAYVAQEYQEIQSSVLQEQSMAPGWKGFWQEFTSKTIQKRMIMVMIMQVGFQFSGGNIITYYNTSILESIGLTSQTTNYLFSGIYGLVKFFAVCCYCLFIIDRLGRRTGLFIGSALCITALIYLTAYLGAADGRNPSSAAGWVAVTFIYIFAIGYALSWGTVPWIINAEVFPTKVRSTCMAICVAWQYLVNFALSRAQPNMVLAMHQWGPFCLFACVTIGMTIYTYFAYPETKGMSMERMEELFTMPWYCVGKASLKVIESQKDDEIAVKEGVIGVADEAKQVQAAHADHREQR